MEDEEIVYEDVHKTPNIDHLIRARFVEFGFSDELIDQLEVFIKEEAQKLKEARKALEEGEL